MYGWPVFHWQSVSDRGKAMSDDVEKNITICLILPLCLPEILPNMHLTCPGKSRCDSC